MTNTPPGTDRPQPRTYHPFAGVLSYLVPGLGQIVQGRVAKGVLFLVCIYTLFFYGIYLGHGTTKLYGRTYSGSPVVYLPSTDDSERTPKQRRKMPLALLPDPVFRVAEDLYNRPQFAGQFFVGVAAWPAIEQYRGYNRLQIQSVEDAHNLADQKAQNAERLQAEARTKDLEAAALREKAKADPANMADHLEKARKAEDEAATARADAKIAEEQEAESRETAARLEREAAHPVIGAFQREPPPNVINVLHNAGDKRLELAWVFTVIAGVLNILVIYDAVAGPAFVLAASSSNEKKAA